MILGTCAIAYDGLNGFVNNGCFLGWHGSKFYKKQLKWGMEKGVLSNSGQGVKRENLVVAYRLWNGKVRIRCVFDLLVDIL